MRPYYEDEWATIYHGDCREVLASLSWHALVTDPPYGLDFPYLSYDDTRDNLRDLVSGVISHAIARSLRSAVLCGPTQIHLYPDPAWVGAITWDTTGSHGKRGFAQWTPVLCYGDDVDGFASVNGGVLKSDAHRITGSAGVGFQRGDAERAHTCPKPLNIMRWVVARFTAETDTVLDPFMGSGTTLVAAKNLGRKATGIEIEERYCEIAAQRLSQGVLDLGGAA